MNREATFEDVDLHEIWKVIYVFYILKLTLENKIIVYAGSNRERRDWWKRPLQQRSCN
jgi:hypothetical protein